MTVFLLVVLAVVALLALALIACCVWAGGEPVRRCSYFERRP